MADNLKIILQQLEAEKSVDQETLVEAIRSAIEKAALRAMHRASHVSVEVDRESLTFNVFEIRQVTEKVQDPTSEISLEDALKLNADVVVGNRLKVQAEPANFGRIAAQAARQVIAQKIKDAEYERIYAEFKQREGDIVTGAIKRIASGNLVVSVGQVEAVVPPREQSPREKYKVGDRIRAIVLEVSRGNHGARVLLSRTSPGLVRTLFEMEVPEIYDGTVVIKAIARDPGSRTKVAVASTDPNVDAVGACVGLKGTRVRAVVEELCGEKIDIIRWSGNPVDLCVNALNPADIVEIDLNEEMQRIHVLVPQDQLSLAIGKRGQNARLASQLVGWNIDIRGDVEDEEEEEEEVDAFADEPEQGETEPIETPDAEAASDASDDAGDADADADADAEEAPAQTQSAADSTESRTDEAVVSDADHAGEPEQPTDEDSPEARGTLKEDV